MAYVRGAAVFSLAFVALAAAPPPSVLGNISSRGTITINGTAMIPQAGPAFPVADRDEIAIAGEPGLFITTEGNRLLLDPRTKARAGTIDGGQTYLYVRGRGGVDFETTARHIYVCIGDRLYVPPTPVHGSLRLGPQGGVVSHLDRGRFIESGNRACNENPAAGFLTGLPAGGAGTGVAAGGIASATAAGTGIGAGVGTAGIVAATAAGAVGVGAASLTGTLSSTTATSSDCTAGCNFNPPPPSPSQP